MIALHEFDFVISLKNIFFTRTVNVATHIYVQKKKKIFAHGLKILRTNLKTIESILIMTLKKKLTCVIPYFVVDHNSLILLV